MAVLPEGVDASHLSALAARKPHAIVGGAFRDGNYMRGAIVRGGDNLIRYWKVGTDGRSVGSRNVDQMPVVHFDDLSVGMLICMDVNDTTLRPRVVAELNRRLDAPKIVCIPGEMTAAWFNGSALPFPQQFRGLWVAVSNAGSHMDRCQSFIADYAGNKVVTQQQTEPIFFDIRDR